MRRHLLSATLSLTLFLAGGVHADVLLLDSVDQARAGQTARPDRGMTMQEVEARFGAPLQRRSAVGTPPITRWEYQDFVVYFEHRHVVHAVAKRS